MSARTFRLVLVLICALYAAQGLHYARVLIPVHDAVRYLFIGAKAVRGERYVEHFPIDVRDGGRDEGLHDIGDEDEVTPLAPVADDGEGSAVRALGDEHSEDGAVRAGRA